MPTTLTQQQTREQVAARREAEYEAYHEWLESLKRDETTDAAERVRAPQQTTIEFTLTAEGLVNDLGQAMRPIIETGLAHAEKMALSDPAWQVEVERRRIELEEYNVMEGLAVEGPGAGVMIARWLIPDAVREGRSTLPGYNRERLKMFNRYAMPTENGLMIGYQSLDGSHYEAVRAMDRSLGYELAEGVGSEAIARERRIIPVPLESLDPIMNQQRDVYDATLTELYGGEWFAGRPPIDVKEVTRYIEAQDDLVSAHMAIVHKVFAAYADRDERMRRLEPHRYNFAAALDARLHGEEVKDLETAGANAREADVDYNGDCPPGTSIASQLEQLGFQTGKVRGTCPHCKTVVEFDPCDPECTACGATASHGSTRKVGAGAVEQVARAVKAANQPRRSVEVAAKRSRNERGWRHGQTFAMNGVTFRYERRLVIGGTREVMVNAETGVETSV